ncbi:unnamed protein product [Fusarium langsethiae]|nr:unnamed protein product [Fusarium langsethiae]
MTSKPSLIDKVKSRLKRLKTREKRPVSIAPSPISSRSASPTSAQQATQPTSQPPPSPPTSTDTETLPLPSLQERLWNQAYDELKANEPKLVEAYEKILSVKLYGNDRSSVACESTENEIKGTRGTRRCQMQELVQKGLDWTQNQESIKRGIDEVLEVVRSVRGIVDKAIQAVPEAAIAWVGVCLGLEILSNTVTESRDNRKGIAYVLSRMEWYWNLVSLLLDENKAEQSSAGLRVQLEQHVVQLYEKLLSYQVKSVCLYHRNWGTVVLRDGLRLDDWAGRLDDIKEAEAAVQKDMEQYNTVESNMQLRKLTEIVDECLRTQKDGAKERLSKEQQECHQKFRLTNKSNDVTYEWYKDRVEERVKGTGKWFLKHDRFQTWLNQESGPLLVTADPGCGKSVLAKYLIDHKLPQRQPSTTICYFFFKDQDQNTIKQALCALLHQLFSLKPLLIEHAMPQFRKDGKGLVNCTKSLWEILQNATRDSQAGPVIMVLDALDECATSEFMVLMQKLKEFHSNQLGKVKFLLTCRPYHQILFEFQFLLEAFPNIHIPGEEESKTISQEVNRVIRHRIDQLAIGKRFTTPIKNHLEKRLEEATHRTYLWVYLVFDYLQGPDIKNTPKGIDSAIKTLPTSVNEAYEKILNKAADKKFTLKVLSIILAASRPLTLSEMNVAYNIDDKCQSIHDLDLEDDEDFKMRLRSSCGLFISIHQESIYFIHQTAREFLADSASSKTLSSQLHWHPTITTGQAHAVLAKVCVPYLNLFNSTDTDEEDRHQFLDYSAKAWGTHFREAGFMDDDSIVPLALRICDTASKSYSLWFRIYWETLGRRTTKCFTDLMIASYYGHYVIVKRLLDKGAEIEAKDSEYGRTPLLWAARNGHDAIVKLLFDKGAEIDAKDEDGRTPLLWAAAKGHDAIVKLLVDKGVEIDAKDSKYGQTPLSRAAGNGHEAIVKLLLDKGAEIDAKDSNYGQIPLLLAAAKGHDAIVKLLVDKGAEIDAKDEDGRTPLLWAAMNGHEAIVKLLVDKGVEIDAKDSKYGLTPLSWAAEYGHDAIVKLLFDKGAEIDAKDEDGRTPLSWAAEYGHDAIVKLLVDKGVEIDAKDSKYGQTPLLLAAAKGHDAIVKLLFDKGAEIDAKDEDGRTPLSWAAKNGHEAIVKLLLDKGAEIDAKDSNYGRTPLSRAAEYGHDAVVKLLLDKGAEIDAKNNIGRTPLSLAAENGHDAVVKLLLDKGAEITITKQ